MNVVVEPPRDSAHGDLSTNAAMVLQGAGMKPRDLAEAIAALRRRAGRRFGRVAGPGFINLTLEPAAIWPRCGAARSAAEGRPTARKLGGEKVNVEYVSANPDRADACRPLPRRGVRRCAGQPAVVRRL
jgi:arginyl-tRNA synthetase